MGGPDRLAKADELKSSSFVLGLDACTMVADGRSLSSLPGDDEQLQLLEGSILAAVRPELAEETVHEEEVRPPRLLRGASGGSSLLSGLTDELPGSALPWILTERAKLAIGVAVLLNAAAMSVEVEAELRFGRTSMLGLSMYIVQLVFLLLFIVELLLNIRCWGLGFFFKHGAYAPTKGSSWRCASLVRAFAYKLQIQGIFDFFVVLTSVVDLCIMRPMDLISEMSARKTAQAFSVFRILQLFRLARIFQLLRLSHELSLLAFNLAMSLKAVFWVFLLLFTLIYIGALFCASELGHSDNVQLRSLFGNLWASIFSHFKLMTLEQWVDVCNLAMEENPVWAVYFLCFIILTNLTLVNLVTGLIITGVVEHAKEEDWTWLEQLVEEVPFIEALEELVAKGNERSETMTTLSFSDFELLLAEPVFQQIASLYGISLQMEARQLFDILDSDGNGTLEIREMAQCLLQLRGSKQCLHPVHVRHEVNRKGQAFAAHVAELEQKLPQQYFRDIESWEQSLKDQLCFWSQEIPSEEISQRGLRRGPSQEVASQPSQYTSSSNSFLKLLHDACVSIEVLRTRITSTAAELRSLHVQEKHLEAQLSVSCESRATQVCHDL
mmetsp:Transcript_43356/g.101173  ORF Transcript_43356/g.101173 Transcript_43356/m.101173 type:complete len:610 (-) Transcript_43356:35-1864(-)